MRIGILCGGGPAPGFNGVINAVTLAAHARGWTVVGIPYGYKRLMEGDAAACSELTPDDVVGIETRGGGILRTNRANPTKDAEAMARVVETVKKLDLDALVTIGGDDTATSAAAIAEAAGGGMRVAHVPKTIDNDLPLPKGAPTFGFETAKALGAELCRNLRADAQTTARWYAVTAMGRSAGHLALGMGVGSGADLIVLPEEFDDGVRLSRVVDLVEAAILKRRTETQDWGLVVLGEGILDRLDEADLKEIAELELDEHGNPRMSEIDLGKAVSDAVQARFKERGDKVAFVTKLIGYELRSADPVAFDVQYTRTLGAGAVAFLADGEGDALITLQDDQIVPMRFDELRDPESGRVPVRRVDLHGALWQGSLPLQARLRPADLEGAGLARFAEANGLSTEDVAERFGSLVGSVQNA